MRNPKISCEGMRISKRAAHIQVDLAMTETLSGVLSLNSQKTFSLT